MSTIAVLPGHTSSTTPTARLRTPIVTSSAVPLPVPRRRMPSTISTMPSTTAKMPITQMTTAAVLSGHASAMMPKRMASTPRITGQYQTCFAVREKAVRIGSWIVMVTPLPR
ncbi:Uncharacterised protein [Mycobacteroides abscessus]|nr:Uncharacterised protein [Mycobacteroides abscessus]